MREKTRTPGFLECELLGCIELGLDCFEKTPGLCWMPLSYLLLWTASVTPVGIILRLPWLVPTRHHF